MNEKIEQRNKEILTFIISDLVPPLADDLEIGFHEADDIIRSTELYAALQKKALLRPDYSPSKLLMALKRELAEAKTSH